jgi:hypothetical protein
MGAVEATGRDKQAFSRLTPMDTSFLNGETMIGERERKGFRGRKIGENDQFFPMLVSAF